MYSPQIKHRMTYFTIPNDVVVWNDRAIKKKQYVVIRTLSYGNRDVCHLASASKCVLNKHTDELLDYLAANEYPSWSSDPDSMYYKLTRAGISPEVHCYRDGRKSIIEQPAPWINYTMNSRSMKLSVMIPDAYNHKEMLEQTIAARDAVLKSVQRVTCEYELGDVLIRPKKPHNSYRFNRARREEESDASLPSMEQIVVFIGGCGLKSVYKAGKPAKDGVEGTKSTSVPRMETLVKLAYVDAHTGAWRVGHPCLIGVRKYRRQRQLTVEEMLSHACEEVRQIGLNKLKAQTDERQNTEASSG